MSKTQINKLFYGPMFKKIIINNEIYLRKIIEILLKYTNMDININDKEIIPKDINENIEGLIHHFAFKLDKQTNLNVEIYYFIFPEITKYNMSYGFKFDYDFHPNNKEKNPYIIENSLIINFNNFSNPKHIPVRKHILVNTDKIMDKTSIVNIDTEACYKLVINNSNLEDISHLERFSGILHCKYLEDISNILENNFFNTKEEKQKFLNIILEESNSEDMKKELIYEDNLEYRFDLIRDQAIELNSKEILNNIINKMKNNNIDISTISKITNKSIEEINSVINSNKE